MQGLNGDVMRTAKTIAAALLTVGFAHGAAYAQAYPTKPVRFVVGFPPGGATDVVARTISQKLSEALGQPVVVDNRAGAASNIAAEHVANSAKDGHVIFMGTVSTSINPTLYKKLPYDPLRDFAPVSQVTGTPFLFVVHPSLPTRDVKEFIALAKARPGQLNYGSAGSGSGGHLFVEMFGSMAGVKLVQVPYKGAAPATTATLSGETIFMFDNIVTTLPLAKAGRLRALAVTTATRSAAAPDIVQWGSLIAGQANEQAQAGNGPKLPNLFRRWRSSARELPESHDTPKARYSMTSD